MPDMECIHEWEGEIEYDGDAFLWCEKCRRMFGVDAETLGLLANALQRVGGLGAVLDVVEGDEETVRPWPIPPVPCKVL